MANKKESGKATRMTQIKRMTITELLDASPRVKAAQGALAAADAELEEAQAELAAAKRARKQAKERIKAAKADVFTAEWRERQARAEDHADELDAALAMTRAEEVKSKK